MKGTALRRDGGYAQAAIGILLASLFLTPALFYLPQATLAATIVVAVLSLVDFGVLKKTWAYSKPDFAAMIVTILTVLLVGVEAGITAGVGLSLVLWSLGGVLFTALAISRKRHVSITTLSKETQPV